MHFFSSLQCSLPWGSFDSLTPRSLFKTRLGILNLPTFRSYSSFSYLHEVANEELACPISDHSNNWATWP